MTYSTHLVNESFVCLFIEELVHRIKRAQKRQLILLSILALTSSRRTLNRRGKPFAVLNADGAGRQLSTADESELDH
jgi:hypothetical protein